MLTWIDLLILSNTLFRLYLQYNQVYFLFFQFLNITVFAYWIWFNYINPISSYYPRNFYMKTIILQKKSTVTKLWTNEWLLGGLRDFSQMGECLLEYSGGSHWELWVISCSTDRRISSQAIPGESHSRLRTSDFIALSYGLLYKIMFHWQYAIERDNYNQFRQNCVFCRTLLFTLERV